MEKEAEEGMATWEGVLSMLSTLIGAGIVFCPFTFYNIGCFDGLIVFLITCIVSYISSYLYMYVMRLLPFNVETIYDLGYLVTKSRVFLIFIAALMIVSCGGMTITYCILFSDISMSLIKEWTDS